MWKVSHRGDHVRTNMRDSKTLADLHNAYIDRDKIFEPDAIIYAGKRIDEETLVREELTRLLQPLRMSTRDIELPGMRANMENIVGAVAKFKKEVVKGADIRPVQMAGDEDLTIELLNVLTTSGMSHHSVTAWLQTGQSVGRVGLFPPACGTGTNDRATLDDDEWLFFTGDFIDFNSNAIIEEIKYEDVDKVTSYNPESIIMSQKGTDMQMGLVSAVLAKSYVKIGSRATTAGATEMLPVAVHICKASLVKGLT